MSHRERHFDKNSDKEIKDVKETAEIPQTSVPGNEHSELMQQIKRIQAQLGFLEKKLDTLLSQGQSRHIPGKDFSKNKPHFGRPYERPSYNAASGNSWRNSPPPWRRTSDTGRGNEHQKFYKKNRAPHPHSH